MQDTLLKPWDLLWIHRFLEQALSHRIDMEAFQITPIPGFDEICRRLPIVARLFDKIDIIADYLANFFGEGTVSTYLK